MTNVALLNNVDHANVRVIARRAVEFGDGVNMAPIFPTEFAEVQREYPILFRKDTSGEYGAVALLGFDKGENLFLDGQGWRGRYVPANLQRGPFMIGFQNQGPAGAGRAEPVIHIDLDHPRVSQTEGEPLFLANGGNAPFLQHIASVLRVIRQGVAISKPMFDAFEAEGLLEAAAIEISLSERETYKWPNCYTIASDKLAALDGAALERLNRAGYLNLAFLVVSSLINVNRLIELKNRKLAAV